MTSHFILTASTDKQRSQIPNNTMHDTPVFTALDPNLELGIPLLGQDMINRIGKSQKQDTYEAFGVFA